MAGPLAAAAALAGAQDAGRLRDRAAAPRSGRPRRLDRRRPSGTRRPGPAGARRVLSRRRPSRGRPRRAHPQPRTTAPANPHVFAGRAWSALLRFVWRTGGGLGDDLPAVLNHLHVLAEPLIRPAARGRTGNARFPRRRPGRRQDSRGRRGRTARWPAGHPPGGACAGPRRARAAVPPPRCAGQRAPSRRIGPASGGPRRVAARRAPRAASRPGRPAVSVKPGPARSLVPGCSGETAS